MKKLIIFFSVVGLAVGAVFIASAHAGLVSATDTNVDPNIFEAYLTADEQDVMIDGTTVHALVYKDDPPGGGGAPAGIPAPQIVVTVGDTLIIHLKNNLASENTSIHWHGIELDNNSDGTGVTQDRLAPGDTYIYRFVVTRPGIFWYHPHMIPTHQDFAGMYGPLVVKDTGEAALEAAGTIPSNVRTVLLSDINFDAATGDVGYDVAGTFTNVNDMIHDCATSIGGGVMDMVNCNVPPGSTVLVNGENPDSVAETPKIVAKSGEGIRLRLINPGLTRYYRLKVDGNADTNLYRIGGEGGFLETVRVEGGVLGTWDTKYDKGEIVLAPADRADVVIVPQGNNGDIIKITSSDYPRNPNTGDGTNPFDVLFIEILGVEDQAFNIAEGNDVLGAGAIEDFKGLVITDFLQPPPAGEPGSTDETIRLTNAAAAADDGNPGPRIDGVLGHFEDSGADFTAVPHADTTRYAIGGDIYELTTKNETSAHHPFHLHGTSFQPVMMLDDMGNILFTFPYNEFVDNVDVHAGQQFVYRVRFDDRGIICDDIIPNGNVPACTDEDFGGATGRWVFHCHIFQHAALGMISEVEIIANRPVAKCQDVTVSTDAGMCQANASIDDGSYDPDGDAITLVQAPSGPYQLGDTLVTLTVTDSTGLTDTCTATVTVEDNEPPSITVDLNPDSLWPPNHKLVNIDAIVNVMDNCPAPTFTLTSVTSDEPDNGVADGNTVDDIQNASVGTPDTNFTLRAERAGNGDGRTYTGTYTATDSSNNQTETSDTVLVPHNR